MPRYALFLTSSIKKRLLIRAGAYLIKCPDKVSGCGCQVVIVLTFYSDDLNSNAAYFVVYNEGQRQGGRKWPNFKVS